MSEAELHLGALESPVETELVVVFFDLKDWMRQFQQHEDSEAVQFLDEFYTATGDLVGRSGGQVVKFMGDAGLAIYSPDCIEQSIEAMQDLSRVTQRLGEKWNMQLTLTVNMHVGPVSVGRFGTRDDKRLDIIGKTVNVAASFSNRGFSLTQQAYRCLSQEARNQFQKMTQPVIYQWHGV
jgi:class 3 adenylate cyclase